MAQRLETRTQLGDVLNLTHNNIIPYFPDNRIFTTVPKGMPNAGREAGVFWIPSNGDSIVTYPASVPMGGLSQDQGLRSDELWRAELFHNEKCVVMPRCGYLMAAIFDLADKNQQGIIANINNRNVFQITINNRRSGLGVRDLTDPGKEFEDLDFGKWGVIGRAPTILGTRIFPISDISSGVSGSHLGICGLLYPNKGVMSIFMQSYENTFATVYSQTNGLLPTR